METPDDRKVREFGMGKSRNACKVCGTTESVNLVVDPYAHEIFGDQTKHWLCTQCEQDLADDV